MADHFTASPTAPAPQPAKRNARSVLTRRLADIVCLPSSTVTPQERWMVADVLEEMLRTANPELRGRVAARLAEQAEAPAGLLRRLALDNFEIAKPILERSQALTDFDMMEIARAGDVSHRTALARREQVSETVTAALVAAADPHVLTILLRNSGARIAPQTMDRLINLASEDYNLALLLIRRAELRPAQAFALFWDVGHDQRKMILSRFAVGRTILQDAAQDVFPLVANPEDQDALVQRTLFYIDRRQRNREANDSSSYGGLEGVAERAVNGHDEALRMEGARLANIQLSLFERILGDLGGEPLGVLAKATGLSRRHLGYLSLAAGFAAGSVAAERSEYVFDTLSVDKAQTVLRYWDWSFRGREGANAD
ncbi:DUF2336 domain-containing protein [Marinicauda sp. Alg238-R41]|uniref:DUF2336 domain-containing protein n=1 Tax=Marinicauda sp. Alg238-R41 TaxID=2993447 RepID=UPI0022E73B2B|nr:DUF2336 domain-containing protein [Marinicauda sp. Alg238-R41]